MTANPKCRTCGKPVIGMAVTKHGGGWVHERSNAERCAPPHRSLAAPVTLEDLNAKVLADSARARRRAGVRPR